jgi:L-alanine-DL-glutamate epimerase-like enolase superfamily enzyme
MLHAVSRTFDLLADLPLRVEEHALEPLERASAFFTRRTTVFHLHGGGQEGVGEDVTYDPEEQERQHAAGPWHPLAGEWTLASFSAHVGTLDLFPDGGPSQHAAADYRRWAIESAALDLALRQAGTSLHEHLGREPRPLTFGVSLRLGDPPSARGVADRIAAYGQVRFKLDYDPAWDEALLGDLAATGAVDVVDLKGAYKGTPVDVDTDPAVYARCAEAFPDAWLEDPDLTDAEADAVLRPHRDRITWDAPIHSVADVQALPFPVRGLNCKPSRFGALERLFDFYDFCAEQDIALYGGGQSELGPGRGQIQVLAAIFHPDGPNDVAPAGWDQDDFPRTGLPTSPLDPDPTPTGFRRRVPAR